MYLRNARNDSRKGGKLDDKWLGPYFIHEKISKGRYKIRSRDGNVRKQIYSSCLLKKCYQQSQVQRTVHNDCMIIVIYYIVTNSRLHIHAISHKQDMQGSLDNISSTCPPLPIVNKGAIKEFFTNFEASLRT